MNLKSMIEGRLSEPFPIISDFRQQKHIEIKWCAALRAYSIYKALFGAQQTLERLAERGGFHEEEIDEYYPEWRNYIISK